MPQRLIAMSHTPLLGKVPVAGEVTAELEEHFELLRAQVTEFNPSLVVLFAPDHYNGFFYDVMPPFCIGMAATAIGDFDSAQGELRVETSTAEQFARDVLLAGYDVTISRAMQIDHGAVQPLEILYGAIDAVPVIPVFVNGVAEPFAPMSRIRGFGEAVGTFFAERDERVLFLASGGLSHDPPVPQWETATDEARSLLLAGRNPTPEARAAREARVLATADSFSRGAATIQDLNPEWDRRFMAACRAGDRAAFDRYESEQMTKQAGHSSHEVRTWVAAFSALAVTSPGFEVTVDYYRPIREYIAGFGLMAAG